MKAVLYLPVAPHPGRQGGGIGVAVAGNDPSWLKLVRTSAAAGDGFEGLAEVAGQGVGGGDGLPSGPDLDGAIAAGGANEFLSPCVGAIMIGVQKAQVGLSNARKTAKVIAEADTRALRHIQRRRAFELVSAQQHHSEFLAQLAPGGVARLTLGHENSYDAVMPECRQVLPVAEYLAETDPELMFLVLGGDALDFRHEDGSVLLPCQVKVRSWQQAAAWFDSGVA